MPTRDAYSSGHLVLSHLGFANVLLLRPLTLNHTYDHQFMTVGLIWLFTEFDSFPWFGLLSLIWHHQFMTLSQSWPLTQFDITYKGLHGACATGVTCRQGTLTPPDTWSRPFGTCICSTCWDKRRRSDPVLWQKPLHQQRSQKGKVTTQTTPQKSSIKQQLRTDLGRSVGVTTATQLVWLTWFTGPPSHSPQQPCNQKTHIEKIVNKPPYIDSKLHQAERS